MQHLSHLEYNHVPAYVQPYQGRAQRPTRNRTETQKAQKRVRDRQRQHAVRMNDKLKMDRLEREIAYFRHKVELFAIANAVQSRCLSGTSYKNGSSPSACALGLTVWSTSIPSRTCNDRKPSRLLMRLPALDHHSSLLHRRSVHW